MSAPAADDSGLVITREWPAVSDSPKASVVLRRLDKARAHARFWSREVRMFDTILTAHLGKRARVLEVACGTGFTLLELAQRGFRMTGLEFDPELCRVT